MSEQPSHRQNLSEISHLFLSSVRQKQMGSSPAPRRKPPARKASEDLTAEEMRQVIGPESPEQPVLAPRIAAVIASHLGSRQLDAARLYARHLAGSGKRIGLIAVEQSEFRIFRYDPLGSAEGGEGTETTCFDSRAMTDALNELSCDLDSWLILVENTRASEGRQVLREVSEWVVLSTCDHEGIVACYRVLKGLSDLHPRGPSLRLAAVDAKTAVEYGAVYQRLANVCRQFLNWDLVNEPYRQDGCMGTEWPVIWCQVGHDKAQLASGSHWQVVLEFVARAEASRAMKGSDRPCVGATAVCVAPEAAEEKAAAAVAGKSEEITMPTPPPPSGLDSGSRIDEVIDLPDGETSDWDLIPLVMRQWSGEVVETPVRPPMCPEARLGVSRDRRLVMIAAAGPSLMDLRAISQGYRWVMENRMLVGMALPQFALDAHQLPHLRLLVDHADLNPEVLKSVLAAETVTLHAFRRVRWGTRRGLLLEAA